MWLVSQNINGSSVISIFLFDAICKTITHDDVRIALVIGDNAIERKQYKIKPMPKVNKAGLKSNDILGRGLPKDIHVKMSAAVSPQNINWINEEVKFL